MSHLRFSNNLNSDKQLTDAKKPKIQTENSNQNESKRIKTNRNERDSAYDFIVEQWILTKDIVFICE